MTIRHGARRVVAALTTFVAMAACSRPSVPLPTLDAGAERDTTNLVARGEYLVRDAAVCGHCHSAQRGNADGLLAGGMEFSDWRIGTARASNLTPDSATGLGAWSDAEIVRAIRNGVHRDGRLLAPVMPYEWLSGMSDRDAYAVARYLQRQRPVRNDVRQSHNLVFGIGKLLFLRPSESETHTAPPRGPTAAYGEYLALHVSLCADCHTPRTGLLSTPDRTRLFAGSAKPPKGFPANPANLTPDSATGIGRWSEADFVRTIRTAVNPAGDTLHPFMPREYRRMTDDDLRAIYRYLRTVPPIENQVPRRTGS